MGAAAAGETPFDANNVTMNSIDDTALVVSGDVGGAESLLGMSNEENNLLGEGSYSNLSSLFANAVDGDTIILDQDYTGNGQVILSANDVTVNGGYHTLTDNPIIITGNNVVLTNLVFKNSGIVANGENIKITESTFNDCTDAIVLNNYSANVNSNTFTGNTNAIVLNDGCEAVIITDNVFEGNSKAISNNTGIIEYTITRNAFIASTSTSNSVDGALLVNNNWWGTNNPSYHGNSRKWLKVNTTFDISFVNDDAKNVAVVSTYFYDSVTNETVSVSWSRPITNVVSLPAEDFIYSGTSSKIFVTQSSDVFELRYNVDDEMLVISPITMDVLPSDSLANLYYTIQNAIKNHESEITLNKDYQAYENDILQRRTVDSNFDEEVDVYYIRLPSDFVLDGNGHNITGIYETFLFSTKNSNNIVIKKFIFTNMSRAILTTNSNNIIIENCSCINNPWTQRFIMIQSSRNVQVLDCDFINNTASVNTGVITSQSSHNVVVDNCNFTNNKRYGSNYGTVTFWGGSNVNITNSYFENNTKTAIGLVSSPVNYNIVNNIFINSTTDKNTVQKSLSADGNYWGKNNPDYRGTSDYWINGGYVITNVTQDPVTGKTVVEIDTYMYNSATGEKVNISIKPTVNDIEYEGNVTVSGNKMYVTLDDDDDVLDMNFTICDQKVELSLDNVTHCPDDSFTALYNIIRSAIQGGQRGINIDKNYKYYAEYDSSLVNGISINGTLNIAGNNYSINGTDANGIFDIVGGVVSIRGLNFTGSNAINASSYTLNVYDCVFNECIVALNITNSIIDVRDNVFNNNVYAIQVNSGNATIFNNEFTDNNNAIRVIDTNNTWINGNVFTGRGVHVNGVNNVSVNDNAFISSTDSSFSGDAVFTHNWWESNNPGFYKDNDGTFLCVDYVLEYGSVVDVETYFYVNNTGEVVSVGFIRPITKISIVNGEANYTDTNSLITIVLNGTDVLSGKYNVDNQQLTFSSVPVDSFTALYNLISDAVKKRENSITLTQNYNYYPSHQFSI